MFITFCPFPDELILSAVCIAVFTAVAKGLKWLDSDSRLL
jgi:hypothetical protein